MPGKEKALQNSYQAFAGTLARRESRANAKAKRTIRTRSWDWDVWGVYVVRGMECESKSFDKVRFFRNCLTIHAKVGFIQG